LGSNDTKYSSNKLKPGKTKAFFVCLIIAAFLWLVHSLNTVYNYSVKVPVTFKNLPQSKKSLGGMPAQLDVNIKASGLKLCLILLSRPFEPVEIDFNTLKSSNRNQNYVLSASDLNFKKSFRFETQIKRISPDTLYFSEKTGYQKTVPLKATLFLKCRQGFGYKTPVVSPAFITIWGDTDLIRPIDTIYTAALNLSDIDHNTSSPLAIIRPGPDVYTTVNEATVAIEVARLVEQTITLPVLPLYKSNDRQVNIYPATVRLRFTSLQNTFNLQDTTLFRVTVNTDKIHTLTKKYPVFLSSSPANVNIMSIEPKEVEILILKK
jgi:hypothetical protein